MNRILKVQVLLLTFILVLTSISGCTKKTIDSEQIGNTDYKSELVGRWYGCSNKSEPIYMIIKENNVIEFVELNKSYKNRQIPYNQELNYSLDNNDDKITFLVNTLSNENNKTLVLQFNIDNLSYNNITLSNNSTVFDLTKKWHSSSSKPFGHNDPIVIQESANLMWAQSDSKTDLNLQMAGEYCANFRGGGYSDWRLPTLDEILGLLRDNYINYYDNNTKIQIHKRLWSSDHICSVTGKPRYYAQGSYSINSSTHYINPEITDNLRALPVRRIKKK